MDLVPLISRWNYDIYCCVNEKDNNFENIQVGNINITKSNIEIISIEDSEIIELRNLLKHKEDILSLLDNNHVNKEKDTNINVSELSGNLKVKTLKIYDSVLKEFLERHC